MKKSNVVPITKAPSSLVIAQQISKLHFDEALSVEKAPPSKRVIRKELKKKMKFVVRKVVKPDTIIVDKLLQPRQEDGDVHNADLRESLDVYGWLHDEQPPVVFQDKNGKLNLIVGFHRYEEIVNLGWGGILVDVYEFEDELVRSQYSICSNHHRKPAKVSKINDVEFEVLKQLKNKLLDWSDDDAIMASIDLMAANKPKASRTKLFNKVLKLKPIKVDARGKIVWSDSSMFHVFTKKGVGPNSEFRLCHGNNFLFKGLVLPFKGDENPSAGLGYSFASAGQPSEQSCKDAFISALYLFNKYDLNDEKIRFYSYITNPHKHSNSLANFYDARKRAKENWISEGKKLAEFVTSVSGKSISLADLPFEFIGFYPQVLTPDLSDGGKPRERTIVNWCGKPIDKVTGKLI
jgi:hypothetical protein